MSIKADIEKIKKQTEKIKEDKEELIEEIAFEEKRAIRRNWILPQEKEPLFVDKKPSWQK